MGIAGYCTVKEAVEIALSEFNVSVTGQTITTWLRDGKISGQQVGWGWLVEEISLRQWLRSWSR